MLCGSIASRLGLRCGGRNILPLSRSSTLPLKDDEKKAVTEVSGKWEKVNSFLTRNRDTPNNLSYPNRYLKPGSDPEVDLKDAFTEIPQFVKENIVEAAKEFRSNISIYKRKIHEDMGSVRHGQFSKRITFRSAESLNCWRHGADSDGNEGFSTCEFIRTDRQTALFRGTLSSKLIKDGRIERAGWAAAKFEERGPFLKKRYFAEWENYSHFLIKCRGDGRTYKITLNSPLLFDITWGDAHSYYLHTHGGPYWQYETIPFSKFIHTVRNRIMDKQYPINNRNVSSLTIMLMDRIDGDFCLEIDYIGVVHDRSHLEEHAYETYRLPLLYSEGV